MMNNANMPAMPNQYNGGDMQGWLTKRESIAALAMQGLLSARLVDHKSYILGEIPCLSTQIADALLAELERTCQKS